MPSPRPFYYIVRPGPTTTLPSGGLSQGPAHLVPLVAVDQLPTWLDIVGVPRELAAADAVNMVAIVGESNDNSDNAQGVFEVNVLNGQGAPSQGKTQMEVQTKDEENNSTDKVTITAEEDTAEKNTCEEVLPDVSRLDLTMDNASGVDKKEIEQLLATAEDVVVATDQGCRSSDSGMVDDLIDIETFQSNGDNEGRADHKSDEWSNADRRASNKSSPRRTKTAWPAQKKRNVSSVKPCRFWCRTGYCAYGQSCRYAHIMPQTPEGLRSVALDQVPDWWVAREARRTRGERNEQDDKDGNRRGRRKSTSPRPPSSSSSASYYSYHYNKALLDNVAMQTSRPPRNWKKTTHPARGNAGTDTETGTGTSTNNDSPPPQRQETVGSPVPVILDLESVDLVDL